MRDIVDVLNRILQATIRNPYARFIAKKTSEPTTLGAFRKYSVTLYLHTPGKNLPCLECNVVLNLSNLSTESIDRQVHEEFLYEVILWIYNGKMKEMLNGLQME